MPIVRMSDLDLRGKRVLIREDLNVPVKDGKVTSEQRILAALPTLVQALDAGAAVMVMSHLGRPIEGHFTEADSLAPVAERLSHHLGRDVPLVRDWLSADFTVLTQCPQDIPETFSSTVFIAAALLRPAW